MSIKLKSLAILLVTLSTNSFAVSFDYIAPSNVYFNQSELGSGIGSPFWGLLIATDGTLTQEALEGATINASIDNPALIFNQSGQFSNLHIYAPLLQNEVAGYSSSGPVTDSANLLAYLNPGESLKYPNGQIQGQSILFENNWLGTANVDYEITIGDQYVAFTTQLHFVETLQDNLWVQVTDGIRLNSSPVPAVPIPASLWLFATGLFGLIGFAKRKKNA